MASMTKRERVLRTIRFEETDRVPLYDILDNDAAIEHYAGQPLTVEDGTWVKGLAIGRALDMTRMPYGPRAPGENRTEQGMLVHQERWTQWIVERPFHDMAGLTHAEIAGVLEISVANSRVLLHRGRTALRALLRQNCELRFDADGIPCERKQH